MLMINLASTCTYHRNTAYCPFYESSDHTFGSCSFAMGASATIGGEHAHQNAHPWPFANSFAHLCLDDLHGPVCSFSCTMPASPALIASLHTTR